jgi:hypothetical protein
MKSRTAVEAESLQNVIRRITRRSFLFLERPTHGTTAQMSLILRLDADALGRTVQEHRLERPMDFGRPTYCCAESKTTRGSDTIETENDR